MSTPVRALLVLLLAAAAPASAQRAPLPPDSVAARVDRAFARWNTPESPGCAVGVARNGRTVLERGYGSANLEHGVPITPATVFEAGSVTKQFVAAAVVLLAQQGKLSLDDPIRKHLPELPALGDSVTLRHILNHASGLRDQHVLFTLAGRAPGSTVHTVDEVVELASRQRDLNFRPGEEYLYSNTGWTLLGVVVKRTSGQSLAEFTRDHLFRPLGMTHTQWRDDHTRVVRGRAYAYAGTRERGFRNDMPFTNVHGSGGLLTTVGDLLLWNENFTHGRVGGPALLRQLQTRGVLNSGDTIAYALGLIVGEYRGVPEVSHGGATGGYRTFLARYPQQGLSVALLCNLASITTSPLAHQVADVFLDGQVEAPPPARAVTLSPEQLASRVGLYRDPRTDAVLRVFHREGKLMLGFGDTGTELVPLAPNRFRVGSGSTELVWEASRAGEPARVRQVVGGERPVVYTAISTVQPSPAHLAEYAGTYRSEELDATYTVSIEEGKLTLRRRPAAPVTLQPTYRDAFRAEDLGQLRFTRDAAGRVDGFNVNAGRVRHLRFTRRP